MDRGLDLFSCLYLIPFAQLFSWTLTVNLQWLEGSDKIVSICPAYRSSWLGVFFHLDHCFFLKFSHIKFIVTEPDFTEEWLMLLKLVKWTKNGSKTGFFWIWWKDWYIIFTEFVLFGMLLQKLHIWENFSYWDIGENVLRQSFWRNFSLTISLEEIFEIELDN